MVNFVLKCYCPLQAVGVVKTDQSDHVPDWPVSFLNYPGALKSCEFKMAALLS